MSFLRPEMAFLLLLVPLLGWALLRLERWRLLRLDALIGPRREVLVPGLSAGQRVWRRRLFLAAYVAAIVAMMQPAPGLDDGAELAGGDLVFCLDVSRSMLARDPEPSRIEKLRQEVTEAVADLRGERLALIAYAGEAVLQAPLTTDVASFLEVLAATDPLAVEVGGTNPASALDSARDLLERAGSGPSLVVLLSDGGDDGGGVEAARRLEALGHRVHVVGIGSARGGRIPLIGETGNVVGYLLDEQGQEIVSAIDRPSLTAIAAAGGGDFLDLGGASLADFLGERRASDSASGSELRAAGLLGRNFFQWPLLISFLSFLGAIALGERRGA